MEQHCARAARAATFAALLALAGCGEAPPADGVSATAGAAPTATATPAPAPTPVVDGRVTLAMAGPGGAAGVDVIVGLRAGGTGLALARAQDGLLSRHRGLQARHRYGRVPAVAARLSSEAMAALAADREVTYVQLDDPVIGHLAEAVPATGANRIPVELGLTGQGVRVAVLDSGIDSTHPDLRASLVAQRCFTHGDCPPSHGNTGTSAEDDHGHGSNVAGIVTSDGLVSHPGFAPGADVVAVKVLDAHNAGYTSDEVAGLDWIADNLDELGVQVVNLSMGTSTLYGAACDAAQPALAAAIAALTARGVAVFASTGNQGSATGIAAPACNTGTISVAATYDSDVGRAPPDGSGNYQMFFGAIAFARCADEATSASTITCFSNTNAHVDVVAPGAPMTSDYLGGGLSTFWGTSQASPAVAAVAALMKQCRPDISPDEIRQVLRQTGTPVVDPKNGVAIPSLRAFDAVKAACAAAPGSDGGSSAGALDGADGGPDATAGRLSTRWAGTIPSGSGGGAATPYDNLGADTAGGGGCGCALAGRAGPSAASGLGLLAAALSILGRRRARRS